jgi:hypothetical protein
MSAYLHSNINMSMVGTKAQWAKIDVSALAANANGATCTGIRIVECHWILHGMTVEVLADADTDIIVLHLAENQQGYQTFEKFGGLPNSAEYGANGTGDIKFTTTGAGAAGDAYQVIIRAVKKILIEVRHGHFGNSWI